MELKQEYLLYGSLAVSAIIFVLYLVIRRSRKYKSGAKVNAITFVSQTGYYKRKKVFYQVFSVLVLLLTLGSIIAAGYLSSRRFSKEKRIEEMYGRDIVICMDISYSVDEVNKDLIPELIDLVRAREEDRFAIVIFNTSPVEMCPLTTDKEYVISVLENIRTALGKRLDYYEDDIYADDYSYWSTYIEGGTLLDNDIYGSSLIPDGLYAGAWVHYKADRDEEENERTKLIIFTSDNELNGTPHYTLKAVGEFCKKENIKVFGVGTEIMVPEDMAEMKSAVEITGGKFYLEETAGTFKNIVDDIDEETESVIDTQVFVTEKDEPDFGFFLVLSFVGAMFFAMRLIRK